jgi:hypothetical protein
MKSLVSGFCFLLTLMIISSSTAICQKVEIGGVPIDLDKLFGTVKLLKVEKGFSPKFLLGDVQLNKIGILGEDLKGVNILGQIFNKKNIEEVTKLYKTYKTGLVVYKVLSAAGSVLTAYTAVRGIANDKNFDAADVRKLLYPSLGSIAVGIGTKLLTKKASYKAVDIFNGIAKKKVKEIFSVQPASSTLGAGIYVKI